MLRYSPFHERVSAANQTSLWSHWAGHLVVDKYQMSEKWEYVAIRNAVGVFDSSPLYKYRFTGPCKLISVGGGENTLTIESVDTLDVGGAKNKITVGTVGTIDVGGADNTITWKKAKAGDKPILKGQPDKNTITQGK